MSWWSGGWLFLEAMGAVYVFLICLCGAIVFHGGTISREEEKEKKDE